VESKFSSYSTTPVVSRPFIPHAPANQYKQYKRAHSSHSIGKRYDLVTGRAVRVYRRHIDLDRRCRSRQFLDFNVEPTGIFGRPVNDKRVVPFLQDSKVEPPRGVGFHRLMSGISLRSCNGQRYSYSRRFTLPLAVRCLIQRGQPRSIPTTVPRRHVTWWKYPFTHSHGYKSCVRKTRATRMIARI